MRTKWPEKVDFAKAGLGKLRNWFSPQGPQADDDDEAPLWHKLAWFAGLSLAGLICVAASAYILRAFLFIGV